MAPLTKESLEVSTSIGELPVADAGTQSKPASGQLRSDAVSMEIAVKVHGSRVTQVVREVTQHTEPFEEQTTTMIVFPQGAVLRMTTAVTVGQMLVVTNSKTRQDAICRIVKIRTFSNAQGYVEIEFSHPQPGYWGVNFSSEGAAPQKKSASAPPPIIQPAEPKVEHGSEISWAPARVAIPLASNPAGTFAPARPEPAPFTAPAPAEIRPTAPESSFISIGSQEKVQPAASSTSRTPSRPEMAPQIEPKRAVHAAEPPKKSAPIDFPSAPPSTPVPSLSMAELLGDELAPAPSPSSVSPALEAATNETGASVSVESAPKSSFGSFGSFSGGSSLGIANSKSEESSDDSLDASILNELMAPAPRPRQNSWFLTAAAIFVLLACAAAGGFYFRDQLGLQKSDPRVAAPASSSAAQRNSSDANRSGLDQPLSSEGTQPVSTFAHTPTVTIPPTTITVSAEPISKSSAPAAIQPPVASKPKGPSVTSDMLAATLNSHPVSASHTATSQGGDAPTIDPSSGAADSGAAMPELPSSANVAAPPPPVVVPEAPIKVGGDVKEPRLLNFKQPYYPTVAKEAHVQGDIVVSTQIDKAGNVVHMRVVSGPTMLREPALQALRLWKYAPSTLNGQPVSVEMQVTIKFRM